MKTLKVIVYGSLVSLICAVQAQAAQSSWLNAAVNQPTACELSSQIDSCAKTNTPIVQDAQDYRLLVDDFDTNCGQHRCVLADAPPTGDELENTNSETSQSSGNQNTSSGPSDRTGYYFLAAIPLIVGVGNLLGIDHRLNDDDSGIWKRSHQLDLEYGVVLTEIGGALWLGGEDRLGRTFWQSLDATAFSAVAAQALKYSFSRARPSQTMSPNQWFQGSCCQSFPSGEVTLQASFVTPFILEYKQDHPWVWSLEALPLYDAIARMKTQGHWQTDVLSAWALGTAFGIFAHNRDTPFFLSVMPHGVMVGWHTSF
ncbi:MAG: phosphatase PAP2 family protein [Gammaproteobacteria bacterium]